MGPKTNEAPLFSFCYVFVTAALESNRNRCCFVTCNYLSDGFANGTAEEGVENGVGICKAWFACRSMTLPKLPMLVGSQGEWFVGSVSIEA